MATLNNTMSILEQDVLQILHARQTASIVMNGPDDDEDINPFEDDDDDSLRRSGANFGLLRDIFEPRMRKSAKRHLLSFRFKSK